MMGLVAQRSNTMAPVPFSVSSDFKFAIYNSIFAPKLESKTVPDKKNRLFGSRILKQLGYPTNIILSQSNISQLQKDLSKLKQSGVASIGMEDLATLAIWDITKQEINTNRLNSCLQFIRENRDRKVEFDDVKEKL